MNEFIIDFVNLLSSIEPGREYTPEEADILGVFLDIVNDVSKLLQTKYCSIDAGFSTDEIIRRLFHQSVVNGIDSLEQYLLSGFSQLRNQLFEVPYVNILN